MRLLGKQPDREVQHAAYASVTLIPTNGARQPIKAETAGSWFISGVRRRLLNP